MQPEIHIDFETRSTLELAGPKGVGLHPYAYHETTDLWCAAWVLTADGVDYEHVWYAGDDPTELKAALRAKPKKFAHNAGFEHEIWQAILGPRYGVEAPQDFSEWTCTAAMAAALALPRDLARMARALGLDVEKDDKGRRLMLQMAKPRSKAGVTPIRWWDEPEKIQRLGAYCLQDARVEHAGAKKLRPLSDYERQIWLLDHKINSRGVRVDVENVRHARVIATAEAKRLNDELAISTRYKVTSAMNHRGVADWLRGEGLEVESVDKAAVKDWLESDDITEDVRNVLTIRQEAGRSSLAKLDAFLLRTSPDGRARHNLMYHGASTGRWSGTGIQLHNLLRAWMKFGDLNTAIEFLALRDPSWLELWGKPLDVIANLMRLFITADEGHELVMADFSNIEGRVLAWLAGEQWKLDAFAAYDAGTGFDLYVVAVSEMMGLDPQTVSDALRQIGKVVELSMGYQGGHGAFISMAGNYGLKIPPLAKVIRAATDAATWAEAAEGYSPANRYDLNEECWVALRVSIDSWRRAHPAISSTEREKPGLWKRLEDAAFHAVSQPKKAFEVGPLAFVRLGSMLWCRLPSGRKLCYANPKIEEVSTPWGAKKLAVTFMGVDSKTKQWVRHKAYGGLWSENVTQAVARDIMAEAMVRVEARGWPVVLTVHDEIVSEVKQGTVSGDLFGEVMRELPSWAAGLPVAAKGLTSPRYRK